MKKSLIFLHIAIFLASLTAIFGKIIQLNEVLITFYRMLFAALTMILIDLIIRKVNPSDKPYIWVIDRIKIMFVGLLLGLHWIFFYASIKYSNVSIGVICFCLAGLFTVLLSPLIKKTKFSINEFLISILALFGILVIFKVEADFRLGILFGIISSILVALFTIFNERWAKEIDAFRLTKYHMIGGSAGLGIGIPIFIKVTSISYLIPSGSDLIYLLLLAIVCTVIMYFFFNKALSNLSAITVNINFNLEPLYAILIASILFKETESLAPSFFIGLFLITLSLLFQAVILKKQQEKVSRINSKI